MSSVHLLRAVLLKRVCVLESLLNKDRENRDWVLDPRYWILDPGYWILILVTRSLFLDNFLRPTLIAKADLAQIYPLWQIVNINSMLFQIWKFS